MCCSVCWQEALLPLCLSYRNWYYDEPSCGGEACVVMYHQPNALSGLGGPYLYQWNDDRCNMKHNFICKYEPGRECLHGTRVGVDMYLSLRVLCFCCR